MNRNDTRFTVKRLTIAVPGVREFRRSYENAVPELPTAEVEALLRRGAAWSEMIQLIGDRAPHGFLIYFRSDPTPLCRPRATMRNASRN